MKQSPHQEGTGEQKEHKDDSNHCSEKQEEKDLKNGDMKHLLHQEGTSSNHGEQKEYKDNENKQELPGECNEENPEKVDRKESGNQEEKVDNVKMLDLEKQIEMSVVAQCKEKLKESIETTMVDQAMAELPEGLKEITNLDEKQEKYVPLNQVNKVDSMVIEIKDLVYQMEMAEDKLQGSGEMDQAMDKVPAGLKGIEEQEGILAKREEKEDKAVPAASFVVAPKRCCGQRIFDTVLKHIALKKGQSRRIRMFMLKHALVALRCSLIGFIIQVELEAAAEKHHWTFPGQVAAYIAPRPLEIFATLFLTYLLFLRDN